MIGRLEICCPICRSQFDYHRGYGRECRCCDKECHDEFNRRYSYSILGKPCPPRIPESTEEATP